MKENVSYVHAKSQHVTKDAGENWLKTCDFRSVLHNSFSLDDWPRALRSRFQSTNLWCLRAKPNCFPAAIVIKTSVWRSTNSFLP